MRISVRRILNNSARVRFWSDYGAVHAATAHAGYPESNLLIDNLGFYCLNYGPMSGQTFVYGQTAPLGVATILGEVAALATNRGGTVMLPQDTSMPADRVRFRVDQYALADRVRPGIASISLTNLTGTAADISGPVYPPFSPQPPGYVMTKLVATVASSNTSATVTFNNHAATERPYLTAAGTQHFRAHYRWSNGHDSIPIVTATLRQGGSDVASMGLGIDANAVHKTSEGWIFDWTNLSFALPSSTGQVGVRFDGATSGGKTPELIGVEWVAGLSGLLYDSGWIAGTVNNRAYPNLSVPASQIRHFMVEYSDLAALTLDFDYPPATVFELSAPFGLSRTSRLLAAETVELDMIAGSPGIAGAADQDALFMADGSTRLTRRTLKWREYTIDATYQTASLVGDTLLHGLLEDCYPDVPLLFSFYDERPQDDVFAFVTGWKITPIETGGGTLPDGTIGRLFDVSLELRSASATAGMRG